MLHRFLRRRETNAKYIGCLHMHQIFFSFGALEICSFYCRVSLHVCSVRWTTTCLSSPWWMIFWRIMKYDEFGNWYVIVAGTFYDMKTHLVIIHHNLALINTGIGSLNNFTIHLFSYHSLLPNNAKRLSYVSRGSRELRTQSDVQVLD